MAANGNELSCAGRSRQRYRLGVAWRHGLLDEQVFSTLQCLQTAVKVQSCVTKDIDRIDVRSLYRSECISTILREAELMTRANCTFALQVAHDGQCQSTRIA